MSQQNVELTRRAFEAISRRDLDALLALTDPEVVAVPRILAVEGGALHGHGGVRTWWEGIFAAFPEFATEVISIRGIGDVTVANVRAHGRGQESGVPFEDPIWVASRVREGKVIWWQTCRTEAEALEAAGLEDQGTAQQNVETVRRGLAAYNAGDWRSLREFYDPDAVMHHLEGWPEPGPSVGREAVMREMEQLHDSFDVQRVEITDIVGRGDRVVARYRWRGVGRGPGAEMEFTFVFTIRDGKCVNEEHFWDHADGLRAAGFQE